GARQALVLGTDDPEARSSLCQLCGLIRGSVVDNDNFEVGIIELLQPVQTFSNRAASVVGADDYRNARPRCTAREGDIHKRVTNCAERGLGLSVAIRDPELPILDLCAAPKPFIRPGINE